MGKVFTSEEIRMELIPEPGAQTAAALHIAEDLFEGAAFKPFIDQYEETGIHSGLVHGSAVHENANIRSDVDVLVIKHPNLVRH